MDSLQVPERSWNNDFWIDSAVERLWKQRKLNGGRIPNGAVSAAMAELRSKDVPVTRDLLNGRLRRLVAEAQSIPHEISYVKEKHTGTTALTGISDVTNNSSLESTTSSPGSSSAKKAPLGGRPQGSTKKSKTESKALRMKVIDAVTLAFKTVKDNKSTKNLPKNTLSKLVEEKKREFGLDESVSISQKTIRSRLGKNSKSLTPKHRGTTSPLECIDELVLPIVLQMGRIRQPMTGAEVIELVNSLISGTEHQERLLEWKSMRGSQQSMEEKGKVGRGYFHGFMKRCGHLLTTKTGRRFACDRADWSKPEYLEQMYHAIYDTFVEANIARRVAQPISYDMTGRILGVDEKEKQFGLQSSIVIDHPDFLLFGDETSVNTNQKEDGQCGGTRYVVGQGMVPLLMSNTTDHRATVLPFTAANGEPVICAVIFAASGSDSNCVNALWQSGVDIRVDPIMDESGSQIDMYNRENYGPGKYFPSGPACVFRGKTIPTLTFATKKGSITSEILIRILEVLDEIDVFDRGADAGKPTPCVVVDGHESRLQPNFLQYINNDEHPWYFSLGVPYMTHLWQVGDSPEQNGSFKINWTREKDELMSFKMQHGLPPRLDATDIMPLLNRAWAKSFKKVESNKRAVAMRGWYPPTFKLLTDPEVLQMVEAKAELTPDTNDTSTNSDSGALPSVNLRTGKSSHIMGKLMVEAARQGGHKRRMDALSKGEQQASTLKQAKRITAGSVVGIGIYSCRHPILWNCVTEKEENRKKEEEAKMKKNDQRIRTLQRKVKETTVKKGLAMETWNAEECKAFLQLKKGPSDGRMPTTIVALRERCLQWKHREDPPLFFADIPSEEETTAEEMPGNDVTASV